jgi:hypothetical protein
MQPTPIPLRNGVTVLTAFTKTVVKIYQLDAKGQFQTVPYDKERLFSPKVRPVKGIRELGILVGDLSLRRDTIFIRGQPKASVHGHIPRTLDNYQEPADGLFWAMLDLDNSPLPEGMDPASIEAIEFVIAKLPEPFHSASYFYQFSSSTGILRPDGTPLKRGLNVHIFFWFSRPITGPDLTAYLKQHCIDTEFLDRTFDKGGSPIIRYGVDFAVFRTVQPHYIAAPIIKGGVVCTLPADKRQGAIQKTSESVEVPLLEPQLKWQVEREHRQILDEHKRANGWVKARSITKARGGGVGVADYYRNPNPTDITTGRELVNVTVKDKLQPDGRVVHYAILFFAYEDSSGSWYVSSVNPTIARRFGDYASIYLKELSISADEYVRDQLRWFDDIFEQNMSLTEQGFLPDISSFAVARNCLILAPTGSGKTTAFCRFAKTNQGKIIIYAAQTIALTRQMEADLQAGGIPVVHYQDFNRYFIYPAVYVTTNESLAKIIDAVALGGLDYILVIDEVHMALDDFMRSERKNLLLERAISRADRTLFMTATLTDIQLKKLTETIAIATGELTTQNFGHYQFQPVKRNSLWWADMKDFWPDFVALLRHYKSLKDRDQEIPRTIIIAPTSKMEPFRQLLNRFELGDQAEVVSRPESLEEEIEEARAGTQPILISSPLFALGLNFDVPPRIFWTYFKHIPVDESQIIQTLNRANRTAMLCEVRLYAGNLDATPYRIPDEAMERLRIEEYFREESSMEGLLDSHLLTDRLTYQQLRERGEKCTAKALHRLKVNDAIQNYTIVNNWQEWLQPTSEDKEIADAAIANARDKYNDDILNLMSKFEGEDVVLLLYLLERNYAAMKDFRNKDRLQKEFTDKQIAVAMAIAGTDDVSVGKSIEAIRLRRLMGDVMVFLSGQFEPERYSRWMDVAAAKTLELTELVLRLRDLKTGLLDGISFGWAMRTKVLRRAVLASANSHDDYIKWERHLGTLDGHRDEYKNKAGLSKRTKLDEFAFIVGRAYLATLGIYFEKTKGPDGRMRLDPKKPVVPDWNFDAIVHRLLVKAESFKSMPSQQNLDDYQARWEGSSISCDCCVNCRHAVPHYSCALGLPVTAPWEGDDINKKQCDAFKQLPAKLRLGAPNGQQEPTNF